MFGALTREEIAETVAALTAQVDRRARAAVAYRDADREVKRLTAKLVGLVPGSQHEVSVELNETSPAVRIE